MSKLRLDIAGWKYQTAIHRPFFDRTQSDGLFSYNLYVRNASILAWDVAEHLRNYASKLREPTYNSQYMPVASAGLR